jgi:hypothetical protein
MNERVPSVETSLPMKSPNLDAGIIEKVLLQGDLSALKEEQRISYYRAVCDSIGLNPLTKPFEYLKLNNKLILYATKSCAEQLRLIHKISIHIVSREKIGDVYVVTARAKGADGREDESTGAVPIGKAQGDVLANLYLKAETKAKRRVTLSICGLGMLDESEVETIPGAIKGALSEFSGHPVAQMLERSEELNLGKKHDETNSLIRDGMTTPPPSRQILCGKNKGRTFGEMGYKWTEEFMQWIYDEQKEEEPWASHFLNDAQSFLDWVDAKQAMQEAQEIEG